MAGVAGSSSRQGLQGVQSRCSRRRASEGFLVLLFAEVCSPRLRYHVAGAVPQSSSGLEGSGSDVTLTRSGEWAVRGPRWAPALDVRPGAA